MAWRAGIILNRGRHLRVLPGRRLPFERGSPFPAQAATCKGYQQLRLNLTDLVASGGFFPFWLDV